ncbi:MAG TPA: hypothetical protein VGK67_33185 [Myxococcales bacterium]|jgi:hypothetical protein
MGFELPAVAALLLHLLAAAPVEEAAPRPAVAQPPESAAIDVPAPAVPEVPQAAPAAYPALPVPPPAVAVPAPLYTLQIEDAGGHVLFVLPDAPIGMSLVLPPGKYQARRGDPASGAWGPAQRVALKAGQQLLVPEAGVTLVGHAEALAAPRVSPTTLPARTVEVRLGMGLISAGNALDTGMTSRPSIQAGFTWGITDRVQLGVLSLAFRVGQRGTVEFVPYLGLAGFLDYFGGSSGFSMSSSSLEGTYVAFTPVLGAGLRGWIGERWSVNVTAEGGTNLQFPSKSGNLVGWSAGGGLGFSYFVGDHAVLNLGVRYGYGEQLGKPSGKLQEVALGSVQSFAGRVLPLLAVEISKRLTLETQMVVVMRERQEDARELRVVEGVAIAW